MQEKGDKSNFENKEEDWSFKLYLKVCLNGLILPQTGWKQHNVHVFGLRNERSSAHLFWNRDCMSVFREATCRDDKIITQYQATKYIK